MGRPAKHDAATRAALLDAAEELLATGGPSAVSVRAVADRVGVSTRAVYSVLGSKDALLGALSARGYGHLADLVESTPVTDDPLADLVAVGVGGFRVFAVERPHLFRLTFDRPNPALFGQPDVDPELQRSLGALLARVDRALASGLLADRSPIEIAFMFHSVVHGLASNELSHRPPPVGSGFWRNLGGTDLESLWIAALTAFVQGLHT